MTHRHAAVQEGVNTKATNKLRSTEDALSHRKHKHKRLCEQGKGDRHKRLPASVEGSHKIYRKPSLLERRRNGSLKNERAEIGGLEERGRVRKVWGDIFFSYPICLEEKMF